jgi:hypothetical protein
VGTLGRFHFYSGSGSSAGKYLSLLDSSSVSYNKWRNKLDALDSEMPKMDRGKGCVGRKGKAGSCKKRIAGGTLIFSRLDLSGMSPQSPPRTPPEEIAIPFFPTN